MAYVFVPFMFLPLYASVEKLDASLIEASADLGASRFQTFRRVVWPATLVMMLGAALGGFAGARIARRLPQRLFRAIVIGVGSLLSVWYFVRP